MSQRSLELVVEQAVHSVKACQRDGSVYCVARLLSGESANGNGSSYVLTVVDSPPSPTFTVPETTCIPVPPPLGVREALLAVPLAAALRVWDRLQLELGEVAVYTDGGDFADILGQVAIWRGALPVIRLDDDPGWAPLDKAERLSISDPDEAMRRLQTRIKDKPGVAAVDLSGRPEIIDLLLEAMPRWGRVMLAGRTQKPLTVDFYNNVHRKGASLLCEIFEPVSIFEKKGREPYLSTAFRLLEKQEIADTCFRLAQRRQLA